MGKKINDDVLDELLKGCERPEDLLGDGGLMKELKKALMQRMLGAELTEHLGYEHSTEAPPVQANRRNGLSRKTVKSEDGVFEIEVPRDRDGSFEPKLIPKGQTRIDGLDDKIIAMYARGMSVRDILAAVGSDSTYHPSRHIEIARDEKISPDPGRFVAAHVRRLEALRRAGIVERWSEDYWKVPGDLPERGLAHDRKGHSRGARMKMLSPIGLDRQVTHDGATWLDNELIRQGSPALREAGFGLEMKSALERRKQVLVQRGDAQDLGQGRIRAPRDLVHRLEARNIERVGRTMAADRGREWTPVRPGKRFGGELVGSTQLPSGRFAMIDNGLGFSLVPWNDAL